MRKKAKQTVARLGLATPKPCGMGGEELVVPSFNVKVCPELATAEAALLAAEEAEPMTSPLTTRSGSEQEMASTAGSASASATEDEPSTQAGGATAPAKLVGAAVADFALEFPPGLVLPPPGAEGLTNEDAPASMGAPVFLADAPNEGSKMHGTGACRPCAWFWKPVGCQNDKNCGYCHLCPESELKQRKKSKQVMMRLGFASPKTPSLEEQTSVAPQSQQESKFALSLASLI